MSEKKKPKILVIDNYDSFTYNLVHLVHECGHTVEVRRNDQFHLKDVEEYDKILLSPGPGIPSEAGHLLDVIRQYGHSKSILGICLGMQAIAEVYGGRLYNLAQPVHGTATPTRVLEADEPLFEGLPKEFSVGRYHSWAVSEEGLPSDLTVTSIDTKGVIMGLRHRELDVRGVQFHPESVMTEHGLTMISNWIGI